MFPCSPVLVMRRSSHSLVNSWWRCSSWLMSFSHTDMNTSRGVKVPSVCTLMNNSGTLGWATIQPVLDDCSVLDLNDYVRLYPAMWTLGCILMCSERRLPRVWSSFFKTKSDVFDMPLITRSESPSNWPKLMVLTRVDLLLNFLLSLSEEEKLESTISVSVARYTGSRFGKIINMLSTVLSCLEL